MWDEKFETTLRKNLPLLSREEELSEELSLYDHGLDSMGTVELLSALEQSYSVKFLDDMLTMETFATPRSLWKALSESIGAGD